MKIWVRICLECGEVYFPRSYRREECCSEECHITRAIHWLEARALIYTDERAAA